MKKTLFLALTLALAGGAAAQFPNIVPAGDTLRGRDSTYFYYTWFDTAQVDTSYPGFFWGWWFTDINVFETFFPRGWINGNTYWWEVHNANWIVGRRMYTPTPISVVGLAAMATCNYLCAKCRYSNPHYPPQIFAMDTTVAGRLPEYLQLYMPKERANIVDSGTVELDLVDEAEWHLLFPSKEVILFDTLDTLELYETHFDTPRIVNGTFFVAGTHNNSKYFPYLPYENSDTTWIGTHLASYYIYLGAYYRLVSGRSLPADQRHFEDSLIVRLPDSTFFYTYPARNKVLCMFPIIDTGFVYVPPVCPEVLNLHREETSDPGVLLFWDAHPAQTRWQVAYGAPGMNPDTCSAVVESSRLWCRLTDLRQGEPYAVFARAWCDSTGSWSGWGDSIMVTYGTAGGGTGGDTTAVVSDPSALNTFTYLFPNPASGRVQVASSFGLRGVEVFALDGRRMLSLPASGLTAAFDTAAWPRGTYIVLIKTPAGSTTKKLSVNGDQ